MLEISQIYKTYEEKPLLKGVSFSVDGGETVCLLGPSGSGKSTLLRIIAGLETPEEGKILWEGRDMEQVPVYKRHFGLMFQNYALFPHKTVLENVAFGLKMQKLDKDLITSRTHNALVQVNLVDLANRRVTDLSGGEQQRVAFARVLAPQPRLLMFDEPLGALDRGLREQLMQDLRQMLRSINIPAIYVTHDQEEALFLADRLLILKDGVIIQQGKPEEIYQKPNSDWIARFLGMKNIVDGVVVSSKPFIVSTKIGKFQPEGSPVNIKVNQKIKLFFTPDSAHISPNLLSANCFKIIVKDCIYNVMNYRWEVHTSENSLLYFELPERAEIGREYHFCLAPQKILWINEF